MRTAPDDPTSRWLKGLLEACVLGILRAGPAYGYDIALRFEGAGFPRPRGGSLYPILARLEADGLVEPFWVEGSGGPGRKYYSLTPSGRGQAEAAAAGWAAFAPRVSHLLGPAEPAGRTEAADAAPSAGHRSAHPGRARS